MLKFKIDEGDFEGLDESVRGFYEKSDGGYALKVDGIPDDGPLRRAKEREAQGRKEAEAKLSELLQKMQELEGVDARKRGDIETLEKSWASKLEAREAELTAQVQALSEHVRRSLVDSVASRIANEISTSPDLILPHIKARLAADFDGDSPKTRVLDSDGQVSALTVDDLKAEFIGSKTFAPVIIASKASGGATVNSSPKFDASKPINLSAASPSELVEYLASKK